MQGANTKNLSAAHVVANLQTLEKRADDLPAFDLVVFDEIHYSFERIKKLIPRLKCSRVVGLTATAYTPDGTPLHKNIIEPFDIQYFIDKGYLTKLKCLQTVLVDESVLKKSSTGDFTAKSIDEVTREDIFNQGIIDATKNQIKGQTIVFAANINHSEKLAAGYRDMGFDVLTMHSRSDNAQAALQSFKDKEAQILVTVDMVSFGTDVPDVETGIVARPVGSKSLWRQIVGRLLRIAPGKKQATLLDCGANLRRLGSPLAPVKSPTERKEEPKPECKCCGYKKAPYLQSFNQKFDQITRIYKCSACGDITETLSDLETVSCGKCNRYHLTTDCTIRGNKEIIKCSCGHVTVVNQLDNLKLVLADDALLEFKLKAAIEQVSGEDNMLEITGAVLTVMTSVNTGLFDRDDVLLMLEKKSLLNVANLIASKAKIAEREAQEAIERQMREKIEAEFNAKQAAVIQQQTIKPQTQLVKQSGIKTLLCAVNNRYHERGANCLSQSDIDAFMTDFDKCPLSHKESAVKTQLGNIEAKGRPIKYIKSFIGYIETHRGARQ